MKPDLSAMTLREKLGQTGIPAPANLKKAIDEAGGYIPLFEKLPYSGIYVNKDYFKYEDGTPFTEPAEADRFFANIQNHLKIPLLISADYEYGPNDAFPQLHAASTNMAMGAANSDELAYKRSYYWAREMRSIGVNWPFSPVVDLHTNFFATGGIRRLSADAQVAAKLTDPIIRGIQDAGVAASAKHFPGSSKDYRGTHFCTNINTKTIEEWNANDRKVWQAAIDAGVMSIMTAHCAMPAMDDSFARGRIPRPASASKKALDILRKEMGYEGLIVTDAVSMKGLAAAFTHEDVYIECFNAGNDIILFCDVDYIEVMEKAVLDGRVSVERVDDACRRVLELKEKLGLFDFSKPASPLCANENADFEKTCYEIAAKGMTLVCNQDNLLPFDPAKVKKVAIIAVSPDATFHTSLQVMKDTFAAYGIETTILERLSSKQQLRELDETCDIIIYACFLAQSRPLGMSVYARKEELYTLFHSLSFGADKSVGVSFGAPSIYYNYFENVDAFINAYSPDEQTMRAFVDGILGKFPFNETSPVPLRPEFRD